MNAIIKKWGNNIGITIYFDLSGHIFRENENNFNSSHILFDFDDITKLTINDIENASV